MIEYHAVCKTLHMAEAAVDLLSEVAKRVMAELPKTGFAIVVEIGDDNDITVVSDNVSHLKVASDMMDQLIDERDAN